MLVAVSHVSALTAIVASVAPTSVSLASSKVSSLPFSSTRSLLLSTQPIRTPSTFITTKTLAKFIVTEFTVISW